MDRLDRLASTLPQWLAWPLSAAGTAFALVGAGLVFLAAAFGSIAAVVWAAVAFVVSGALWYASEFAQSNRGPGSL